MRSVRKEAVTDAFAKLWQELFESPVHLDSALAKRPSSIKSKLAQLVTPVLLRPQSWAL